MALLKDGARKFVFIFVSVGMLLTLLEGFAGFDLFDGLLLFLFLFSSPPATGSAETGCSA